MNSTLCHRRAPAPLSRREFLARTGGGFGAMALSTLLGEQAAHAIAPHHAPRARL